MPVLLIEPVSNIKRRRYFEALTEPNKHRGPDLAEVKQKLKEIRHYSLDHLDALRAALAASLSSYPGVEVINAVDAEQAIESIRGIARGARIAINKSSVVSNELVPGLVAAGHDVFNSYYDEFERLDNGPVEYWQLPTIPFESRFQSFDSPVDLTALRSGSIRKNGSRDFVGLLGVNAVSAEDGAVVMLQHMSNIGKVVQQARELILVVGLDKIVKSVEDAIFQTKCMAIFGAEALPLTIHGGVKQADNIDRLPFEIPREPLPKIHLVLLDNGRSNILKGSYKELLACIDCQACAKGCPASPFFTESARWSPRQYLYSFITGKNPSLDLCLQCKSCEPNCPLDIDLPGMILDIKAKSGRRRPLADTLIAGAGTLERWGSPIALLANALAGNRPVRWMMEKALNISRQRQLPRIQRRTFAGWFKSRERHIKESNQSG